MFGVSFCSLKSAALKMCLLTLAVLSLPGCALFGPKAPGVDHHYTGFLEEYRAFNETEVEEADYVSLKFWAAPGTHLNQFSTLEVQPVDVAWGIQRDNQVTHQAVKSIQSYLETRLSDTLSPLVTNAYLIPNQQPTSGRKLVVKAAITGLETKDERYQVYEMLPAGIAITTLSKLIGIRDEEVNLHLEVAFIDDVTGQVIAKSLVGIVGNERLENRWEEVTLAKLSQSIDEWTRLQTHAFQRLPETNFLADSHQQEFFIGEQESYID